jgi:hypothetical protein
MNVDNFDTSNMQPPTPTICSTPRRILLAAPTPQLQDFRLLAERVPEDIFILPESLAAQLRRKAEITLDHLNDAYRLYERRQGA